MSISAHPQQWEFSPLRLGDFILAFCMWNQFNVLIILNLHELY